MESYLKITYEDVNPATISDNYEYRNKPFAESPVYNAFIENFETLTQGNDVKAVYRLKLSLKDVIFDFLPGDVISVLPENDEKEVKDILTRLNLNDVCHYKYNLEVLPNTMKKNPSIPKHLPQSSTLYNTFLKYIDIRTVPKKTFLKGLIKYTKDSTEQGNLEFVCSPSGSNEYLKLLEHNRSLLALLKSFPSCFPPVELILEHSTPLNPRYFSIASSPLSTFLCIVFYVVELENGLKGVCTGWFERIIKEKEFKTKTIPIYFRKPGKFRLNNTKSPNILIATGTGLAPFLGFLQHKKLVYSTNTIYPETWLFYGCRYSTRDFLCQEELRSYLHDGVLVKMSTAFSREGQKKEYVQQKILECKEEVTDFILNKGAVVYVCGDIKTVVKDVKELIIKCFMESRNINRNSAEVILNNLINYEQFLVDSWM